MRSGLLKKLTFPDPLTNQLVANLSDAINTLSSDDDVFTAPSTVMVGTGKLPAGAATVFYRGAPGAQLTLPSAQSQAVQGNARAALVVLGNEASGAITLLASGGDSINGAKSLSLAAGALAMVASDGFSRWLVLAPAYDVIASGAFSSVSSLPNTWTAGKYRRLEAHLRVDSGSANGYMSFLGLSGETYSRTGYYASPTAVFTNFAGGPSGTAWVAQGVGNQVGTIDVDVSCAASSQKMFRARIADAGGYQAFLAGTCSDATNPVTGLVVTFTGATSGSFELLGYQ
jgi:hypothetical protein